MKNTRDSRFRSGSPPRWWIQDDTLGQIHKQQNCADHQQPLPVPEQFQLLDSVGCKFYLQRTIKDGKGIADCKIYVCHEIWAELFWALNSQPITFDCKQDRMNADTVTPQSQRWLHRSSSPATGGVCLSVLSTFVFKFKMQKEIDIKFSWWVVHDEQLNNSLGCQNCRKNLKMITMLVFLIKDPSVPLSCDLSAERVSGQSAIMNANTCDEGNL